MKAEKAPTSPHETRLDREGEVSDVEVVSNDGGFDAAFARRVVRKVDYWLIPLLFVTYNFNFMDKTILSSASVFGLREDTGLHGEQYSWVSSIFYFGYMAWTYPTSILIQKLPVGTYIGYNTIFWGAVVALTAACTNYGGLLTVRFLLGVAEATTTPAFVYLTSMWYTRNEIPVRTGIWFAGNSLGGLISNFLAYGVGHITHPLTAWQWLFIILGVGTFLWAFALIFMLPNTIESARFLTEEERQCCLQRVVIAGTGKTRTKMCWPQVLECLKEPKTYLCFSISLLTQIPNSGVQNFGNLVLKGFGFTSLQTTLVITPASVITFVFILATGWASGHYKNIATYLVILVICFPVCGSAIIYADASKGVKLFAYYLLSTGPAALPIVLSLVGVNYKGSTKKMTMTAIMFLAYCTGNIAGPHFFIASEAPHYETAFRTILVCYVLAIGVTLLLRLTVILQNRRRDKVEGDCVLQTGDFETDQRHAKELGVPPEDGAVAGGQDSDDDEELTDLNTPGFRYRM
ncbi:hypothetical protein KEM52_004691 [Ascosphaera acerosa]|nr:hypothetical protein KEM52_004691 [Ascosphaera acerosa]